MTNSFGFLTHSIKFLRSAFQPCLDITPDFVELNKIISSWLNDDTLVPLETETILAATIKTSYLRIGQGDPVLFLHGGGAGVMAWQRVIKEISKSFCIVAPDLVGYGESDKPHAFYGRHFFSHWLKDFMDALGLKKCVLVGHSLGGAIALQFALDHPGCIERLVLVCSAALGFSFPLLPLLKGMALYSFPSRQTSWYLHTCLVHCPASLDEKFIEYAGEVCRKPGGKRAFWGGCITAVLPFSVDCLKKITQRTALIWGAEDRVMPLIHAQRALRIMPDARLHVIPRAGHIPFFDQPEKFNDVLLEFLEDRC